MDPVSGVSQEAAEVSEEAFSDSEDAGFADQGQTEDAQTEESGVTEEDGIVTEGSEEEQSLPTELQILLQMIQRIPL